MWAITTKSSLKETLDDSVLFHESLFSKTLTNLIYNSQNLDNAKLEIYLYLRIIKVLEHKLSWEVKIYQNIKNYVFDMCSPIVKARIAGSAPRTQKRLRLLNRVSLARCEQKLCVEYFICEYACYFFDFIYFFSFFSWFFVIKLLWHLGIIKVLWHLGV